MPPQGGDPPCATLQSGPSEFQSTPPHGRRLEDFITGGPDGLFQSTPPHGRRQAAWAAGVRGQKFQSTPPHGRRPGPGCKAEQGGNVSIHASAREATRNVWKSSTAMSCFNPRLRTGGDVASRREEEAHACFNPRLRTGGDALRSAATPRTHWFQSTPPHGRRLAKMKL
mgnify:CR=1 FL=1